MAGEIWVRKGGVTGLVLWRLLPLSPQRFQQRMVKGLEGHWAARQRQKEGGASLQEVLDLAGMRAAPKEGGVFVPSKVPPEEALSLLEGLQIGGSRAELHGVRGHGRSEDLPLLPSSRLKVQLAKLPPDSPLSPAQRALQIRPSAAMAPQEVLFEVFRPFGLIRSLSATSPDTFSLTYASLSSSINSKMALNGAVLQGSPSSLLQITYDPISHVSWLTKIWDSIMRSRFIVPILLIATSFLSYFLVNPLRTFNVTQTLAMNWSDPQNKSLKGKQGVLWVDREEEERLQEIFSSRPSSPLLITSEAGVGKSSLITNILDGRKFSVRIDCDKLKDSFPLQDEGSFIDSFGEAVGFQPSFGSLNTLISYIEKALMIKDTPARYTRENQFTTLLSTVMKAISALSRMYPNKPTANYDYMVVVFDGFEKLVKSIEVDPEKVSFSLPQYILSLFKTGPTKPFPSLHTHFFLYLHFQFCPE